MSKTWQCIANLHLRLHPIHNRLTWIFRKLPVNKAPTAKKQRLDPLSTTGLRRRSGMPIAARRKEGDGREWLPWRECWYNL
jgi:hypothetical protein